MVCYRGRWKPIYHHNGFYPCDIHVAYLSMIQEPRYYTKPCPILSVGYNFSDNLATLYTQSRPIMLSRRCLAATAGTSLVRDSLTKIKHHSILWEDFTAMPSKKNHLHENASSNASSLTKIPHCCRWWDHFKSQVTGRPLRPVKDNRQNLLRLYPNLIQFLPPTRYRFSI